MSESPTAQRAETWRALTTESFDVLVIGGGIVGAGVARDAAMRGLRTGLVEQHDFAFGTSGRSSRLLHGGIRYLAQGRLGLVREASLEKAVLHRIAPHLAQPLAFIFPSYPATGRPLWQLRAGVKIYDLLCGGKNLGQSRSLSRAETLQLVPWLKPDGLAGAVRYFDGLTNDARLVFDTLRSAHRHGATLLNYGQFQDASRDREGWRCSIFDKNSGAAGTVRSRTVVNASGPWAARLPHSRVKLRLTKGIHLAMRRERIPAADAVVLTEGNRLLFVIPWGERLILGTTDTDYAGSLDAVRAEPEDVDYLLRVANEFFPAARLTAGDIVSSWAGVRPLLADANGKASDISRAHQIRNPEPGWWDVTGGKLTTYRLMAEQTVDRLMKHAGLHGKPCATATETLFDKPDAFSGILPAEFTREAVAHFCHCEWAWHLDDLMIRRAGWHYYDTNPNEKAVQAAQWMAEILGWPQGQKEEELKNYHAINRPLQ